MREPTRQPTSLNYQQIATVAYRLWEQAGRPDGRDVEFWLQAERQTTFQSPGVAKSAGSTRSASAADTAANVPSSDVIGSAARMTPSQPKRTSATPSARPR